MTQITFTKFTVPLQSDCCPASLGMGVPLTRNTQKNICSTDYFLHGDYLYVSSVWEECVYGYEFELERGRVVI